MHELQSCTCSQSIGVSVEGMPQRLSDSKPGRSGMLHKRTNEWIGLREEKGVYVFDGLVYPAVTAGRKRPESVSLTPYEHNVDVALVDFPRQENRHP